MKKAITIIGMIVTTCAFATEDGREITTSQRYVETQLSNRQDTIPVKTGDKVVTPTSTKGVISEREIKTTLGDEMTNQSDTGITTVETAKVAVDAKQAKLKPLGGVNVVTYTGTETNVANDLYGAGFVTSTPIYDENVNTYGNGLVRAETLNTAVQRGVSRALTQVPAGFVINKIGDVLPTTMYYENSDETRAACSKRILTDASYTSNQNSCSNTLWNSMVRGDWSFVTDYKTGITYPNDTCTGTNCYKEIYGISACSSESGSHGVIDPDNISATLQNAYEQYRTTGVPSDSERFCHCKVVNPHIGIENDYSPWVYASGWPAGTGAGENCALHCVEYCVYYARANRNFRAALFGGVDPTTVTNQANE